MNILVFQNKMVDHIFTPDPRKTRLNHDLAVGSPKIVFCGESDESKIEIPFNIGMAIMPKLKEFLPASAYNFKSVVIFPEASVDLLQNFGEFLRTGRVVAGQHDCIEVVALLLQLGVEDKDIDPVKLKSTSRIKAATVRRKNLMKESKAANKIVTAVMKDVPVMKDKTIAGIDKVLARTSMVLGRSSKKDRFKKYKSSGGGTKKDDGQDNSRKVKDVGALQEIKIPKKKIKCCAQNCNSSFPYESSYTNHLSTSHGNSLILKNYIHERMSIDGAAVAAYECKLCDKAFKSKIGAIMHVGRAHSYFSDAGVAVVNEDNISPHSYLDVQIQEGDAGLLNFDGDLFDDYHLEKMEIGKISLLHNLYLVTFCSRRWPRGCWSE